LNWKGVIVFLAVYYFMFTFIMGAVSAMYYQYGGETAVEDTISDTGVYTYEDVQEWYDYIDEQFESMKYDSWEEGEKGLSDRITIGPVYHLNYNDAEYPKRREIFEPGSWESMGSQWLSWLTPHTKGKWRMLSDYWDNGNMMNISYGEPVFIYPHIYYNSPGVYIGGEFFKAQFLVIWGFDATQGQVFRDVVVPGEEDLSGVYDEEVNTGYAVSMIYKFYAGPMPAHDLLYVIDACVLKNDKGLVDGVVAALKGGASYDQIETMFNTKLDLAERYMGRIKGDKGAPDEYYWVPSGIAPHQGGGHGIYNVFSWLQDGIKGMSQATSGDTPTIIRMLYYGVFIGPILALLGYGLARHIISIKPF